MLAPLVPEDSVVVSMAPSAMRWRILAGLHGAVLVHRTECGIGLVGRRTGRHGVTARTSVVALMVAVSSAALGRSGSRRRTVELDCNGGRRRRRR